MCSTFVFFIHAPCFLMRILFYFSFVWLHVYVFAIYSMVHCGSAFEPGASRLPCYCTSICVRSWWNWRASCVDSIAKNNNNNNNWTWQQSLPMFRAVLIEMFVTPNPTVIEYSDDVVLLFHPPHLSYHLTAPLPDNSTLLVINVSVWIVMFVWQVSLNWKTRFQTRRPHTPRWV